MKKSPAAFLIMAILLLAWLGMAPATQAETAKTGEENEQQGLSRLLDIWDKQSKKFVFTMENKNDPFMPAVTREATEKAAEKTGKPLTPLQKMDLTSIKLVAVIVSGNESMALVEDTTQMGYIVKVGTYMGTNNGRVVGIYPVEMGVVRDIREIINPARIEVQEKVRTYLGTTKTRIVTIPLKGEEK
ncbi:MAG: pilus assembly protein PilP [Candidatus Adiutricales bacterium]